MMRQKIIKWCIRRLVFVLNKDDALLCYSFSGGEHTEYHIMVERFYEDRHTFGTRTDYYEDR